MWIDATAFAAERFPDRFAVIEGFRNRELVFEDLLKIALQQRSIRLAQRDSLI